MPVGTALAGASEKRATEATASMLVKENIVGSRIVQVESLRMGWCLRRVEEERARVNWRTRGQERMAAFISVRAMV